jgi:hypothetical protein
MFLRCLLLLLLPAAALSQRLSPLAPEPVWAELEAFQETITRAEFVHLLDAVYAPRGAAAGLVEVGPDAAIIRTRLAPPATRTLRFAPATGAARPVPRFWRPAAALGPAPAAMPLQGWRIALDPGHIGGEWARMEERWFRIGETLPVTEGDMALRVTQLLAPQLTALGAEVLWVREKTEPVTSVRPEALRPVAREELARQGRTNPRETYESFDDPTRGETVQALSELFFYRTAEIRDRAKLVNEQLRPDITVCLHFNAEAWGDPRDPQFVPRNHLHTLINGAYSAGELRNDDVRFEMLMKLLTRCLPEELAASEAVVSALAQASGLPPFHYPTNNAHRVGSTAYVWARNLLANRLYRTPVIFLEPVCDEQPGRLGAGAARGLRRHPAHGRCAAQEHLPRVCRRRCRRPPRPRHRNARPSYSRIPAGEISHRLTRMKHGCRARLRCFHP